MADLIPRNGEQWKRLTDGQREYLDQHNGCFKCRKINVNHRANTCSFVFPRRAAVHQADHRREEGYVASAANSSVQSKPVTAKISSSSDHKPSSPKSVKFATIPMLGQNPESKFLFAATINGNACNALLDSGSTAMVMSESYALEKRFPTFSAPPCSFTFANSSKNQSSLATTVMFKCANYEREMTFYIAPIKEQVILGTPFWEAIVTKVDWAKKRMEFSDSSVAGETFSWAALGLNQRSLPAKSSLVASVEAILTDCEWFTCIDLEQVDTELEMRAQIDEIAAETAEPGMYKYQAPVAISLSNHAGDRFNSSTSSRSTRSRRCWTNNSSSALSQPVSRRTEPASSLPRRRVGNFDFASITEA